MIMKKDVSLKELSEIVLLHGEVKNIEVTDNIKIGEDLLIIGDDADEMILDLNREYGTDFSNLNLSEYFPSECSADMFCYEYENTKYRHKLSRLLDYPLYIFWNLFKSKKQYKTMTLGDLLKAVKEEKW